MSTAVSYTHLDEIGGLANDINSLYQSLLVTIRNLEEEKDKVQLVEKEKIDFLRTASHELKTPDVYKRQVKQYKKYKLASGDICSK